MSEINGPKFSVNQVNFSGIQKPVQEQPVNETSETTPQITDFSDSKAEALGRSMLFKGVDDVNNDLKALIDNPQIAEKLVITRATAKAHVHSILQKLCAATRTQATVLAMKEGLV